MRTYDFAPLGRYSIGFDHLFDLINQTARNEANDGFPPYNILRTGSDTFRISIAVAGFGREDLSITSEQNLLTVSGRLQKDDQQREYLYKGIAGRGFERKFNLGDYVEVENASTDNGLLHIDLIRRVPEAMKPRTIDIGKPADKPPFAANNRQAA